jgi:hypothetical protein
MNTQCVKSFWRVEAKVRLRIKAAMRRCKERCAGIRNEGSLSRGNKAFYLDLHSLHHDILAYSEDIHTKFKIRRRFP